MSASDRLREAAAKLREAASASTAATGKWEVNYIPEDAVPNAHIIDRWFVMDQFESGNPAGPYAQCEYAPTAHYIALMSPPVALAVADWLDAEVVECEALMYPRMERDGLPRQDAEREVYGGHPALALADAILGGQA